METDRSKAIKRAVGIANPGDWVLVLGKGHEQSMSINGVEYPWSDVNEVSGCLDDYIFDK